MYQPLPDNESLGRFIFFFLSEEVRPINSFSRCGHQMEVLAKYLVQKLLAISHGHQRHILLIKKTRRKIYYQGKIHTLV